MATVVGIGMLGEYVLSVDLGIDELLQEHHITLETSRPGRMRVAAVRTGQDRARGTS